MAEEFESQFKGRSGNFPKNKLPSGVFQADHNGERFKLGGWRRRRGLRHLLVEQFESPVQTIIGFQTSDGRLAILIQEGTNVHGFLDVGTQDETGGGFGNSPFGGGGFGE